MIQKIRAIFKGKKEKKVSDYAGLSDFLMHAPKDKKTEVLREAARLANEDQLKTFDRAKLKIKAH